MMFSCTLAGTHTPGYLVVSLGITGFYYMMHGLLIGNKEPMLLIALGKSA
jgi:hypothetical protein